MHENPIKRYAFCLIYGLIMLCGNSNGEKANPDAFLPTPQIIAHHGYTCESHQVLTEDGYILTLHRIPFNKNGYNNGRTVLLQHGILGDSSNFVTNPSKSLAFELSDVGYDVWMSNIRGNTYSKYHVNLTEHDTEFWNFSWDQMAKYDMPAIINYICKMTKKLSITYVGHSMGTTIFYATMASNPQLNHKISAMFSLAPIAFLEHVKSPIRLLAPFGNDFEWIAEFLGETEFLPNNKLVKLLANYGCNIISPLKNICENIMFVLFGFNKDQVPLDWLPVILNHCPAGTSSRTVIQFAQEIHSSGKFQYYDYGSTKNQKLYGRITPPEYNVSKITVPIYLYYSDSDWLAVPIDVEYLFKHLENVKQLFKVPLENFNHLDFIWGKNATNLLYSRLINDIESSYQSEISYQVIEI